MVSLSFHGGAFGRLPVWVGTVSLSSYAGYWGRPAVGSGAGAGEPVGPSVRSGLFAYGSKRRAYRPMGFVRAPAVCLWDGEFVALCGLSEVDFSKPVCAACYHG